MHRFMTHYTAEWMPASIRVVSTSLRSYFTFRGSKGEQTAHLIAALPQVAQWHLAGLPQQLTSDEIEQLLGAFDRRRATGRRDYAITRCLRPRDRPVLARWAATDDSARAIHTPPSTGQRASRSGYRA
jgi:site-specific recombinase XerD